MKFVQLPLNNARDFGVVMQTIDETSIVNSRNRRCAVGSSNTVVN